MGLCFHLACRACQPVPINISQQLLLCDGRPCKESVQSLVPWLLDILVTPSEAGLHPDRHTLACLFSPLHPTILWCQLPRSETPWRLHETGVNVSLSAQANNRSSSVACKIGCTLGKNEQSTEGVTRSTLKINLTQASKLFSLFLLLFL